MEEDEETGEVGIILDKFNDRNDYILWLYFSYATNILFANIHGYVGVFMMTVFHFL